MPAAGENLPAALRVFLPSTAGVARRGAGAAATEPATPGDPDLTRVDPAHSVSGMVAAHNTGVAGLGRTAVTEASLHVTPLSHQSGVSLLSTVLTHAVTEDDLHWGLNVADLVVKDVSDLNLRHDVHHLPHRGVREYGLPLLVRECLITEISVAHHGHFTCLSKVLHGSQGPPRVVLRVDGLLHDDDHVGPNVAFLQSVDEFCLFSQTVVGADLELHDEYQSWGEF